MLCTLFILVGVRKLGPLHVTGGTEHNRLKKNKGYKMSWKKRLREKKTYFQTAKQLFPFYDILKNHCCIWTGANEFVNIYAFILNLTYLNFHVMLLNKIVCYISCYVNDAKNEAISYYALINQTLRYTYNIATMFASLWRPNPKLDSNKNNENK